MDAVLPLSLFSFSSSKSFLQTSVFLSFTFLGTAACVRAQVRSGVYLSRCLSGLGLCARGTFLVTEEDADTTLRDECAQNLGEVAQKKTRSEVRRLLILLQFWR